MTRIVLVVIWLIIYSIILARLKRVRMSLGAVQRFSISDGHDVLCSTHLYSLQRTSNADEDGSLKIRIAEGGRFNGVGNDKDSIRKGVKQAKYFSREHFAN